MRLLIIEFDGCWLLCSLSLVWVTMYSLFSSFLMLFMSIACLVRYVNSFPFTSYISSQLSMLRVYSFDFTPLPITLLLHIMIFPSVSPASLPFPSLPFPSLPFPSPVLLYSIPFYSQSCKLEINAIFYCRYPLDRSIAFCHEKYREHACSLSLSLCVCVCVCVF